MIDLALAALVFFIAGCLFGRADLRASRKQKVQTIDTPRLYLAWSNPNVARKQ